MYKHAKQTPRPQHEATSSGRPRIGVVAYLRLHDGRINRRYTEHVGEQEARQRFRQYRDQSVVYAYCELFWIESLNLIDSFGNESVEDEYLDASS